MKPLVIYHASCWDGFCAAWVARKALGEIEAVPAQYGVPPPDVTDRKVYIVDFSYPREQMRQVASQAKYLIVLDHHKTAQEALDGFVDEVIQRPDLVQNRPGSELPYVQFDMTKSGGRLAWEHFNPGYLETEGVYAGQWIVPPVPWLVDYTEDRDLWRHALEGTQEINAALRSYPLDFELWDQFEQKDPRSTFYYEGAAIRRAETAIIKTHVRNAREITMDGYRVLSVNATVLFSEIAGELAKGSPFGACYFDRQDGKRQWSLRSDDLGVDVSAIAKAHGGGGHFHAAGYEEQP
jgi:oligoribonuclease NrnB/cAMP/cGMP phosphodiesterase (DHH superfamily)